MAVAEVHRIAPLPADMIFWFWGRPLRIVRTHGDDAAAPVIVEEMANSHFALAGQYGLWSAGEVRRVLASNPRGRR